MSSEELNSKIYEFIRKEQLDLQLWDTLADAAIVTGIVLLASHITPETPYKKSRIGNVVFDNNSDDKRLYQAKLLVVKLINEEARRMGGSHEGLYW